VPTIFSHAIVATAAGQWLSPRASPPRLRSRGADSRLPNSGPFWFWTIVCAMLPDIDVIGFSFGIQYGDMFGHRGFTHSLFFAALIGLVAANALTRSASKTNSLGVGGWQLGVGALWAWFAAVTMSHGVLDAMTNGGRGIAFFAPFSNHRYFFPWRPIQVSPIGAGFFSARGFSVLVSEARWIWLPSAIIAVSARMSRRPT
jgi:inner membrane protein